MMSFVSRLSKAFSQTGYEVRRTDAKRRAEHFLHNEIDLVLDVGAGTGRYASELRTTDTVADSSVLSRSTMPMLNSR
jgi:hypothetical protein